MIVLKPGKYQNRKIEELCFWCWTVQYLAMHKSFVSTSLNIMIVVACFNLAWPCWTITSLSDLVQVCLSRGWNSDARERSKKARKYERKVGRDGLGYPASAPNFSVGFFLRRRGLRVENNNKFSRQFLQVIFAMLQMSQVRLSLLFSWYGLESNQVYFTIYEYNTVSSITMQLYGLEGPTYKRTQLIKRL
jgi:hypothetical protein